MFIELIKVFLAPAGLHRVEACVGTHTVIESSEARPLTAPETLDLGNISPETWISLNNT